MWNILLALIQPVSSLLSWGGSVISSRMEHTQKIKELRQEAEIKSAEREVQIASDADIQSVESQKDTWKDEVGFYTIWGALWGLAIPYTRPHVIAAFEALKLVPEWYTYLLVISYLSVSGSRVFAKYILPKLGKK